MKILFALALLAALAVAADPHPKQVGASEINFSLKWVVENQGDTTLKVFPFENNSQQTVFIEASKPFSFEKDAAGNQKMVFRYQSQGRETIEVKGRALVDYSKKRNNAPSELAPFLAASPFVIKSEKARQMAEQATQGSRNDYEKLVRLTEWVHNYVSYDEAFWQTQETSDQVIDSRRGVCDEYSHLLLALLREENIPARFVAGFVYSGKAWDAHAWVEAIIGGEVVPVDPTYGEAGYLDGTHVKFSASTDQTQVTEEVTASAKVEKPQPFFTIERYEKPWLGAQMEFTDYPKKAGSGDVAGAVLTVQNSRQEWNAVPLTLVVPTIPEKYAMQVLDEKDKLFYLGPGEKKSVSWQVKYSPNLEEGFEYNFTSYAVSLGQNASFTTIASAKNPQKQKAVVQASQVTIEEKQGTITLKTTLANNGNADALVNATATLGGTTTKTQLELKQGESKEVALTLPAVEGKGMVTIEYEGNVITAPFDTSISVQAQQPADYYPLIGMALLLLILGAVILKR